MNFAISARIWITNEITAIPGYCQYPVIILKNETVLLFPRLDALNKRAIQL